MEHGSLWTPDPPHHLMSFTCTRVCHNILPRFYQMCQNPVEWQYSTLFRYLQPGEAGELGERILGGGHVPAMVTCSVLLGLQKTCTLLFRNHCLELPLSWMPRGSCRNATFLLGVLPAQNPGGVPGTWPGYLPVLPGDRAWNSSLALLVSAPVTNSSLFAKLATEGILHPPWQEP